MTKPTLTLPIVNGRQYVRRDGKVITAKAVPGDGLVGVATDGDPSIGMSVYRNTGLYSSLEGREEPRDLVADYYVAEQAEPTRRALLKAIADGHQLQHAQGGNNAPWTNLSVNAALSLLAQGDDSMDQTYTYIRVKPNTVLIGSMEVPAPVRNPIEGEVYYTLDFTCGPSSFVYTADRSEDARLLRHGLIHATAAAAELHQQALVSFTTKAD